jgi:hypothetical protein
MGLSSEIQDTAQNFITFVGKQKSLYHGFRKQNLFQNNNDNNINNNNNNNNNNNSILYVLIQHPDVQLQNRYKLKSKFQTRTKPNFPLQLFRTHKRNLTISRRI